jgi:hypothetical protein
MKKSFLLFFHLCRLKSIQIEGEINFNSIEGNFPSIHIKFNPHIYKIKENFPHFGLYLNI